MKGKENAGKMAFVSFGISCIASLSYARYILDLPQDEQGILLWIKEDNLHFYLSLLLVFLASFLCVRLLFLLPARTAKKAGRLLLTPVRRQALLMTIPAAAAFLLLARWCFYEWPQEWPQNANSMILFLMPRGFLYVMFAGALLLAAHMMIKDRDISFVTLLVVYALCLAMYFYNLYVVNIFKSDMHHIVAVLESIYNVCDLTPFSIATSGVYGHYSLFFLLPMRLAHGSQYMAAFLLAVFGCVTTGAAFYVSHRFLNRNWLRAAAACACTTPITSLFYTPYYQIFPIRKMFPMLLCAYVCYLVKHRITAWKTKWTLGGYLLGAFAVLWNTESGLFCLAAFSAYLVTEQLQLCQWYEKQMLVLYVKAVLFCAGAVFTAVGILNVYNLLCGGGPVFRAFFFPLFTDSYMEDVLRHDMVFGNHAWVYAFLLFAATLSWGLFHTRLFKSSKDTMCKDAPAVVTVAVLGLLAFSYYVNRAAWGNLSICSYEAVLANTMLIGTMWDKLVLRGGLICIENIAKKSATAFALAVIVCLGATVPFGIDCLSHEKHSDDVRSLDGVAAEWETVAAELPENVYGAGYGISILYHMAGWENYAHVRDFSDLTAGGWDAVNLVVDEIMQQDAFFISAAQSDTILKSLRARDTSYQCVQAYTIQEHDYYYYKKR